MKYFKYILLLLLLPNFISCKSKTEAQKICENYSTLTPINYDGGSLYLVYCDDGIFSYSYKMDYNKNDFTADAIRIQSVKTVIELTKIINSNEEYIKIRKDKYGLIFSYKDSNNKHMYSVCYSINKQGLYYYDKEFSDKIDDMFKK
mgnify:CR=1 FL=1